MSETIPVFLCGEGETIGGPVTEGLKPEVEVIQFFFTPEEAAAQMPAILNGNPPESTASKLGSQNYAHTPVAVVVGAAEIYGDEGIATMRATADTVRPLAWLRPDKSYKMPPRGPEYGKIVVQRVKDRLFKLKEEGKLDGKESGVYFY